MPTVDFAEVKERVSITDALHMLGVSNLHIKGQQLRGPCPICKDEGDRKFVVTPNLGLFHCFACQAGGDQITLVAKMRDLSLKDAALWLIGDNATSRQVAVPQEQGRSQPATSGLKALDYLEPEHEAVLALGINPVVAKRLGIGYAPKGVARGEVLFPIRDEHGTLHGYIGTQELSFIPKDFELPENIVQFKKPA